MAKSIIMPTSPYRYLMIALFGALVATGCGEAAAPGAATTTTIPSTDVTLSPARDGSVRYVNADSGDTAHPLEPMHRPDVLARPVTSETSKDQAQAGSTMRIMLPTSLPSPSGYFVPNGQTRFSEVTIYYENSSLGPLKLYFRADSNAGVDSADKMMATNEAGPVTILASGAHAVYMADGVVASLILWVPASGSISLVAKDSPKTKQVLVSVANEMLG